MMQAARPARANSETRPRRFVGTKLAALFLAAASVLASGCTGILHEQRFVPDLERGEETTTVIERRDHLRRMAGGVLRLSGRNGALVFEAGTARLGVATERVRSGTYAFGPLLPFIPFPVNDEPRETLAVLLRLESESPITIDPDATRVRTDGPSIWHHAVAVSNGFQFDRDVHRLDDVDANRDTGSRTRIEKGGRLWLHFDIDPKEPDTLEMELAIREEGDPAPRLVSLRFKKNRATFFVVMG